MVQAHLEGSHSDYLGWSIKRMLWVFVDNEDVLFVDTSEGVHVDELVLKDQFSLEQMVRDLLLE